MEALYALCVEAPLWRLCTPSPWRLSVEALYALCVEALCGGSVRPLSGGSPWRLCAPSEASALKSGRVGEMAATAVWGRQGCVIAQGSSSWGSAALK